MTDDRHDSPWADPDGATVFDEGVTLRRTDLPVAFRRPLAQGELASLDSDRLYRDGQALVESRTIRANLTPASQAKVTKALDDARAALDLALAYLETQGIVAFAARVRRAIVELERAQVMSDELAPPGTSP